MVVYRIKNIINGKCYVGCTIDFNGRIKKHFSGKFSGSILLYKAVNKYGKENFIVEIIKSFTDINEMYSSEKENIKSNNSLIPNGYNIHHGGKGGKIELTIEQAKKRVEHAIRISKLNIGNKWNIGRVHSDEVRKATSIRVKGIKRSEETKRKISIATKGNKRALGTKRTEEHKKNMSNVRKGAVFSEETKKRMSISAKKRIKNAIRDEKGRIVSKKNK